ncbi:unnamed protein product [Periconia digitata]|uniref:Cyclin-dependent kinase n=1 Tax=Periconia digitata TaxID=1303443 RepID=A0A9W4U7P9_9PLEO|nr:unnamed protein product [Periconia digitata]
MIHGGAASYPATMLNMDPTHAASLPPLYKPDLPASQESRLSAVSSTFSPPQLPSSSSNLSTSTTNDTELTTPPLSQIPVLQELSAQNPASAPLLSPNRARAQDRDASLRIDAANALRTGDTAASPMSLCSPVTHGFKRSADGSVKGANFESSTALAGTPVAHPIAHKRSKSMDTSRIGEISAQLKTRLSYAMVKVQNGWEKQSLEELEEQTSQQGSPISNVSRNNGSRPTFDSPLGTERPRRPSGVSDMSDHIIMSPNHSNSDPSRSLATSPPTHWRPSTNPTMNAAVNLISVTGSNETPMLGPAPDLSSRRKRRSSTISHYHPPPLLGSSQRKHYSDLSGTTPRTPVTPRAGILRMPSQQAEKDAVDTLLFMSSPNHSGRVPPSHSASDGAARAMATPRRVMFEAYPAPGKAADIAPIYHAPQAPPPNSQHAHAAATAYYHRAEPSR